MVLVDATVGHGLGVLFLTYVITLLKLEVAVTGYWIVSSNNLDTVGTTGGVGYLIAPTKLMQIQEQTGFRSKRTALTRQIPATTVNLLLVKLRRNANGNTQTYVALLLSNQ